MYDHLIELFFSLFWSFWMDLYLCVYFKPFRIDSKVVLIFFICYLFNFEVLFCIILLSVFFYGDSISDEFSWSWLYYYTEINIIKWFSSIVSYYINPRRYFLYNFVLLLWSLDKMCLGVLTLPWGISSYLVCAKT